jgi:Uncharacterized conserved protein
MLKKSLIISVSPEIMGGTPVFALTRVPVQTLLDYLKAGESIDDFLDGFPTVTKKQVIALLEEATEDTAMPFPYPINCRDTALPISVNLSLKALRNLVFT